jgi:PAS domain S-box-containing protein
LESPRLILRDATALAAVVPAMPRWVQQTVRISYCAVAVIAVLGLLGWLLDVGILRTFGAEFPPLAAAEGVSLLAVATALLVLSRARSRNGRYVIWACAGVVALVAGASAVEQFRAGSFGVDLGFPFARGQGRIMGPGAAGAYFLLAIALAAAPLAHRRIPGQVLRVATAAVALIAITALVGLTFRIVRLDFAVPLNGLALPAAVALLCAAFNLAAVKTDSPLLQWLSRDTPGASITRRLIPAAIVIPILLGWLQALGHRSGWFDIAEGEGVLAVSMAALCSVMIVWVGRILDEMNSRRSSAEISAGEERELLQVTLANIGDAVIATNRDTQVRFMNRAAEKLCGLHAGLAAGRPLAELLELVDEGTREPIASPLPAALAQRRAVVVDGEPAIRLGDGSLRSVEASAIPIQLGSDDIGGVLVLRDARAQRGRERAMREANEELDRRVLERTAALQRTSATLREKDALLHTLAASTSGPIFAKDRQGRFMMVNTAALALMGRAQEEVLGRTTVETSRDPEEAARTAESEQSVMETGEPIVVEESFSNAEGTRTFLITKSPLRDDEGKVVGLVGVATDITERKRIEQELEQLFVAEHKLRGEAERASRAKDDFLAIVSHELRSPLNALRGWSHLIATSRSPDASLFTRGAEAIRRNVEHQTRLIDDLLDVSRIVSGKLVLERKPVNLAQVVQAAIEQARPAAAAKEIELKFSAEQPVMAEGDHSRLQQVVTNLIANAIKFTPERGSVAVLVHRIGSEVRLAVRDTGIGISPEFLPHVFDRFSQADTSSTRRHGGLGIGLALVKHLIELHGGRVKVESPGLGRGSTFICEIPATQSSAIPATAPGTADARPETALRRALEGLTVFVVDDDPDARDVLELGLLQSGAQVKTFSCGRDLITALAETGRANLPEVLLLDIAMPDEDGYSVLSRVHSIDKARNIPAIAVTAFSQVESAKLAAAGFHASLGKPVDLAKLTAAISSAVVRPAQTDTARLL